MSSTTVRQQVDDLLSGVEWNDAVLPYFRSVNSSYPEPDDVDALPMWVTAEFEVFDRPPFCIGDGNARESGAWFLVIMGQSFSGPVVAPELAWAVAEPIIAAHVWPAGMRCEPAIPPQPDTYTPGDRWQRWDIVVPYEYDTTP